MMNKSSSISINIDRLFKYIMYCETNDETANRYVSLLNDKEKQDLIDIFINIKLAGRYSWNEAAKAQISPYLIKYAPVLYKGNAFITPITNLSVLNQVEQYILLSNWNFFVAEGFFLYIKNNLRTIIKVENEIGEPTAKILDPDELLTKKQKYEILAEMNLLMAEQS